MSAEFRESVRRWCANHVPPGWQEELRGASRDDYVAFQHRWLSMMHEAGFAVPHWPEAWGGRSNSGEEKIILLEEMARAHAPRLSLFTIGIYHAAATLLQAGTLEQQRTHLPAILRGEVWCQAFSEPGAGSDLASLRTRATRDGADYVVTGQKTWSSMADMADYALLLARTGSQAERGRGISYFILDMKSPGIEVRPIRQSTGDDEFCEIFLTDVRIPETSRIGAEGAGWSIAQVTLSEERSIMIVELVERLVVRVCDLLRDATERNILDSRLRQEIAGLVERALVLRSMSRHLFSSADETAKGSDISIIKLMYGNLLRDLSRTAVRAIGMEAMIETPFITGGGYETGSWFGDFLSSGAWTIAGGTDEIHRNLLATRGLGMRRSA